MASLAAGRNEFADLDQLIVRSLVTLRMARAACGTAATPRDVELRDQAEETLNALLDFRSCARRRRSPGTAFPGLDARLPA